MVELLLSSNALVSAPGNNEQTALHRAAAGGHAPVVTLLLEKGEKGIERALVVSSLAIAPVDGHEGV